MGKNIGLFLFCTLLILICSPSQGWGSSYHIKYLNSIDGVRTGQAFKGITAIYIDDDAGELYILDAGNGRVVITDLAGVPLLSFRLFKEEGAGLYSSLAVDKKGRIRSEEHTSELQSHLN